MQSLGGYQKVTQEKKWGDVAQQLKLKQATQCAYALRQHYSKLLTQYEVVQKASESKGGGKAAEVDGPKRGARGGGGASSAGAPGVPSLSWHSLALVLLEVEEAMPWDAVAHADEGQRLDWSAVRPSWMASLAPGQVDGSVIAQAR